MNIINETYKSIYFDLLEEGYGFMMARYIFAQAAHETGNFTSEIFLKNNNLFGMKLPVIRATLATGENLGHATFKSISDCIKDFALYIKAAKLLTNYSGVDAYVKALKSRHYFEAEENEYTAGVRHFYNLYFNG